MNFKEYMHGVAKRKEEYIIMPKDAKWAFKREFYANEAMNESEKDAIWQYFNGDLAYKFVRSAATNRKKV